MSIKHKLSLRLDFKVILVILIDYSGWDSEYINYLLSREHKLYASAQVRAHVDTGFRADVKNSYNFLYLPIILIEKLKTSKHLP